MIKILIVDDDREKLQKISKVLSLIPGIDLKSIDYVNDASTAKLKIRDIKYELLIIDIAIPTRIDQDVVPDGGIKLLNEVFEREQYHKPRNIIGITAYDDIYAQAQQEFYRRLLSVIKYNPTEDEWERVLTTRVKHILLSSSEEEREPIQYSCYMCIICALDNPELSSVLKIPWSWKQIKIPDDDNIYYEGVIEYQGNVKKVYAAAASRVGLSAASVLAMKMIMIFRPNYVAMTGIAAGIPGKTRIGDIITADPCWDWGSGKWTLKNGSLTFLQAPHQLSLDTNLRNKLRQFCQDKAIFALIRTEWAGESPDHELIAHIGPMASGSAVLADGITAEQIKTQHRDLLGIEMETYGIFLAAEESLTPKPLCIVMKSVVDFADGNKNDRFQKYASYTSARALQIFTEKYLTAG